jgi:hypothetical protein
VTSQASSGVVTSSLNPLSFSLTARYSGKILPAWRINHTGTLSVSSPRAALKIKSFFIAMGQM